MKWFIVVVVVAFILTAAFAENTAQFKKKPIKKPPIIRPLPPRPPAPTNCTGNSDCGNFMCKRANCQTKLGVCTTAIPSCTRDYKPVCGCDGLTYTNACQAQANRTNVDTQGVCSPKRMCMTNTDCSTGNYCRKIRGICNSKGWCDARPQFCTMEYAPVCGCDGKTYGNSCGAASNGANVAYAGACQSGPQPPPPPTGRTCKTANDCPNAGVLPPFCWREKGLCETAPGVCFVPPASCPDIYSPVCGCDGNTYENSCAALSRKMNIMSNGACKNAPGPGPNGPGPGPGPKPGPGPMNPGPGPMNPGPGPMNPGPGPMNPGPKPGPNPEPGPGPQPGPVRMDDVDA